MEGAVGPVTAAVYLHVRDTPDGVNACTAACQRHLVALAAARAGAPIPAEQVQRVVDRREVSGVASAGRASAARHRPDDEQRFCPCRNRRGQRRVQRFVGQVLLAREESHECAPALRRLVADRATQHRVACLERVEDRPLGDRSLDDEGHLAVDAPENPQVCR
jgi:hypothetical protein